MAMKAYALPRYGICSVCLGTDRYYYLDGSHFVLLPILHPLSSPFILCLLQLDVFTALQEVKIGVTYSHNGIVIENMPSSAEVLEEIEVEDKILP